MLYVLHLRVVGGRHGVGAVEVEQVRDAAQHRLLRARAPAAPEVVQPAAWVSNVEDSRRGCHISASIRNW